MEVVYISYFEKELTELLHAIKDYEITIAHKRKNIQKTFTLLRQTKKLCLVLQEKQQTISKTDWNLSIELLEYITYDDTIKQNVSDANKEKVEQLLQEIQTLKPSNSFLPNKKQSIADLLQEYPILKCDSHNKKLYWLGLYTTVSELYDDIRAILLNRVTENSYLLYIYQIAKEIETYLETDSLMINDPNTKQFLDLVSLLLNHPLKEELEKQLSQDRSIRNNKILFKIQYRLKQYSS